MFANYYEIMEISPNASSETVDRIFHIHALRYHPDNQATGDRARFDEIMEAYDTLKDPVKRAQYDIQHEERSDFRQKLAEKANDSKGIERDVGIQNKLLSILYIRRRQNINDPGLGDTILEQLLRCPPEHLEFHLWYLKEKKLVARLEDGMLAITVEGVDHINSEQRRRTVKLLTNQNQAS